MDASERERFGRYETLFRIAAGGMAEVYAARALGEAGFQKLVALKRMRPELADDARFATMFLDEGRLAANIASPNVVSTLDLGRAEDNSLYLVMELITGVSVQVLMHEAREHSERIPIPCAVEIIVAAANGLHDAHEARSPSGEPLAIVHRDCSGHNVLVDVNGQVKITDFGIAKAMERQTQSQAGEMKGKLSYLSPEQARGLPVDRRTDIFILGIVAWEIFAGRQLFVAEHPVEALHKVATMPIPRLDEVDPSIPRDIAAAVGQALERDPAARFATATAFGTALVNALGRPLPPRAELGALVRRLGGKPLSDLEQGIRTTLGANGSAVRPVPAPPRAVMPVPPPRAVIPQPAPSLPVPGLSDDTDPAPRRRRIATKPYALPLDTAADPPALGFPETRAAAAEDEAPRNSAELGTWEEIEAKLGRAPADTSGTHAKVDAQVETTGAHPKVHGPATRLGVPHELPTASAIAAPSATSRPRLRTEPLPAPPSVGPVESERDVATLRPAPRPTRWAARIVATVTVLALAAGGGALVAHYSRAAEGPVVDIARRAAAPSPRTPRVGAERENTAGHPPAQLPVGRAELPTGEAQLPSGQAELPAGRRELPAGREDLPAGRADLPRGSEPVQSPSRDASEARTARRGPRRARTIAAPRTVGGSQASPEGDRAAAFDEIPWH